MRKTLFTTAAVFVLACAAPGFAQTAFAQTDTVPAAPGAEATTPPSTEPAATSDQQAPAKPMMHHHMHHAMQAKDTADDGAGGNWAHQPGTGESGPASMKASNITAADSHSDIAPHFPQPIVGEAGGPEQYLMAAQKALAMHHTGAAQQALEMAETRLLDRSTPVSAAGQPDQNPMVASVAAARQALGKNDMAGAKAAIKTALATPATSSN